MKRFLPLLLCWPLAVFALTPIPNIDPATMTQEAKDWCTG